MQSEARIKKKAKAGALLLALLLFAGTAVSCGSEKTGPNGTEGPTDGLQKTAGVFTDFKTQDIYGNEVDQKIFQDHEVTMINVWGTFCPPCLEEMPDLGELNKAYAEQGFQIVGIVVDVQDQKLDVVDKQLDLAKEIVDQTGADYQHLLITPELVDGKLGEVYAIPHTFFVDKEGNELGKDYQGSRPKKEWSRIIEDTLKEVKDQEAGK